MKRIFEIDWPPKCGPLWMNQDNLMLCINAYCENKDGSIKATDVTDSYRRLPEGDHLLPDSERQEMIDYLLKSMPGRWKQRDMVELCVRTMSQVCIDKLRGKK